MKKIFYLTIALCFAQSAQSQLCTQTVGPHAVVQGTGSFHITTDTTMPYNDGSDFYVCAGVHLTMTGSAGCNYVLEEGALLTIMDHDGDNVIAKGNCTITDYSTETIVISALASTTVSKPNDPGNFVFMTCPSVTYDYSLVGGSAPCGLASIGEEVLEPFNLFPNPISQNGFLQFGVDVQSVSVFDLSGREIIKKEGINKDHIELQGMNKGIFIVKVITLNGNVFSDRLIIE